MDSHNTFETRTTARLLRLEWLAGLGVAIVLALLHLGDIRWPVFIGFFVVIDAIGYIPGAIAYRRSPNGVISRNYYLAYNVMHSLLTAGLLAGAWALLVGPEWALLAIPIHLFGDRGIFGNSLKPFGISFEPVTHKAFADFQRSYASAPRTAPPRQELADVGR